MPRPSAFAAIVSVAVSALFLATCLAGPGSSATTPIQIETEPGGLVYAGMAPNASNANGALFWNLSSWQTNDAAAHAYFLNLLTGERLKNETPVLNVTGDTIGFFRQVDNVTIRVKDLKGTLVLATKKKASYSGHELDITVGDASSGNWTLRLRTRYDGRDINNTYFQVYLQDTLNHTLIFKEGIQAMATGLAIPGVLEWDVGGANRTFFLPNASSQYWLDVNGGSDMGGLTFKLVTGTLDLSAVGLGNGTTVIRSVEIKYTNSTGSLNSVAVHPQAETLAQEKGKSAPKTPAATPVLLLSVAILAGLLVGQRRKSVR